MSCILYIQVVLTRKTQIHSWQLLFAEAHFHAGPPRSQCTPGGTTGTATGSALASHSQTGAASASQAVPTQTETVCRGAQQAATIAPAATMQTGATGQAANSESAAIASP